MLAVWLASLGGTLTQSEHLLWGTLKHALQVPELTWADAERFLRPCARRLTRTSLQKLLQSSRVSEQLLKFGTSPDVIACRMAIRAWAAAREDVNAVACTDCGHGVGAGVICGSCAKVSHYGCAWRSMAVTGTERFLPRLPDSASTLAYTCNACRQGTPKVRGAESPLMTRFRRFVDGLEVDGAVDLIDTAVSAGPARRRLPGSGLKRAGQTAGRFLAVAAVSVLVDMTRAGDRAAEMLLMFAPRLFMRKRMRIEAQLEDLMLRRIESPDGARPPDPHAAWVAAVQGALEDGGVKKLASVVTRGPKANKLIVDAERLREHYPTQSIFANEHELWKNLRDSVTAVRTPITVADVKRWARKHITSSGGTTGWTGALMLHVSQADPSTFTELVRLWSRPPAEWLLPWTVSAVLRRTDGWPISKDIGFRPITAPQTLRRIKSAVAMRKAFPLVERYCRQRGQFGLSGEAYTIAYSLLPMLTVHNGGTVLTADRSMSFQTLRRDAVYFAVKDCIGSRIPAEDDAAAALLDACLELYVAGGQLAKTFVGFDDVDDFMDVDGLAQGCSLSPVLEAVVLAWQAAGAPTQTPGLTRLAAHDDIVVCGQAEVELEAIRVPDCSVVGGSYNEAKAVALGKRSAELVIATKASRAATVGSVWGRPVGGVEEWLRDTLYPRFTRKCEQLRALATTDAAVAIWSAHAFGGPGSMTTHALRGLPLGLLTSGSSSERDILMTLTRMDEEWLDLLVGLAGARHVAGDERVRIRDLVYGRHLGHVSAAEIARAASAAGMATALPVVCHLANDHKMDLPGWADLLASEGLKGVRGRRIAASEVTTAVAHLKEVANAEKQTYEERRPTAGVSVNLWVEALAAPTPLHAVVGAAGAALGTPGHRAITVKFALARALGLPVWDIVGGLPNPTDAVAPAVCGLCRTATTPTANATASGPRAILDAHGEHVGACTRTGMEAWNTTRHNRLVRVAVEIGLQAGIRSQAHDGPIFQLPGTAEDNRKRPADLLEVGGEDNAADAARYPAGRCIDVTIRTGGPAELEAAAKAKIAKYAGPMAQHKHIGFTVLAVSYSGCVNAGAEATFRRWAYHIARTRRAEADILGRPLPEVQAAFALGFATVATAQVAAYADQARAAASSGSRAAHATRAYAQRARPPMARIRSTVSPRHRYDTLSSEYGRSASPAARSTPIVKRIRRARNNGTSTSVALSAMAAAPTPGEEREQLGLWNGTAAGPIGLASPAEHAPTDSQTPGEVGDVR